jgi:hypothetical protein
MNPTTWTSIQVEAAMCLWEATRDAQTRYWNEGKNQPLADAPDWAKAMYTAFEANGSLGMMHALRHAAIPLEAIWQGLPEDLTDGVVYDWEFMPFAVRLIDWAGIGSDQIAHLVPDAEEQALAFCRAEKDQMPL